LRARLASSALILEKRKPLRIPLKNNQRVKIQAPEISPFLRAKLNQSWPEIPDAKLSYQQTDETIRAGFESARDITRHHAKSFYFASFFLPKHKREAAYAIYAFCRLIDDRIDEAPADQLPDRDNLLALYDSMMRGERDTPDFAPAFRLINETYTIPDILYHDLIEGCCLDREPCRMQTFAELERYCYYVASVVGLIMSRVFGLSHPTARREAIFMGIAMQLTNILRDVAEDWQRGRIYLPAEELAAFGLNPDSIAKAEVTPAWESFMAFQVARAQSYYDAARPGFAALADDGSAQTARVMSSVYGGILKVIASRGGDVFRERAYVPFGRKCLLALTELVLDWDCHSDRHAIKLKA
jgi:phytoene synthase